MFRPVSRGLQPVGSRRRRCFEVGRGDSDLKLMEALIDLRLSHLKSIIGCKRNKEMEDAGGEG